MKTFFLRSLIPVACALSTVGCVTTQTLAPEGISSRTARHEYSKNYNLNQTNKAAVGEAIIKVRDYYVEKYSVSSVTPSETFHVSRMLGDMVFQGGKQYAVKGTVLVDGIQYLVVPCTENNTGGYAILVSSDGSILNRAAIVNPMTSQVRTASYEWKVTPQSAKVAISENERISTDKGYENYEIIYNGTDNKSLFFTYREFSPEGLARTAFYQNMTYDALAKSIKFKKFRIIVNKASSEEISYTVIED